MSEQEILDEGELGDRGDGDTGAGDDGERARIWLHRTDVGFRIVWDAIHPSTRPEACDSCSLFIEAAGGGRP